MNQRKETYLQQIEALQRENLQLKQKLQTTNSELHQLKQNEDKFQNVFEASPNGFILVDAKGNITLVNEKAESMFGYSRDELVGQKIELLIAMAHRHNHEHYRDEFFKKPVTRSMGAGRDLFGLHKNGSQIPVEIGLNPFATSDGTFVIKRIVEVHGGAICLDSIGSDKGTTFFFTFDKSSLMRGVSSN